MTGFYLNNSQLVNGDVVDELRRIKESDGPELHIWGSSNLLQTLIAAPFFVPLSLSHKIQPSAKIGNAPATAQATIVLPASPQSGSLSQDRRNDG
jgi:hypothetical protein